MRRTVLIVDDHEAFRESASALLEEEGFTVVGQAADGEAAIAESERLRPDVVCWTSGYPVSMAATSEPAARLRGGRWLSAVRTTAW